MKRIVGVTYCDGLCIGVTVDGIDDKPVYFERIVHGRWIWRKNHWECSVCRNNRFTNDIVLGLNSAYCSYCGAKMDEVIA